MINVLRPIYNAVLPIIDVFFVSSLHIIMRNLIRIVHNVLLILKHIVFLFIVALMKIVSKGKNIIQHNVYFAMDSMQTDIANYVDTIRMI